MAGRLLEQREGSAPHGQGEEWRGAERRDRKPGNSARAGGAGLWRAIPWFYWVLLPVSSLTAAFAFTYGFHRLEAILLRDPRFKLPRPAVDGELPPTLKFTGVKRASMQELLRVFEADIGRSLYLFPVAERRRNLLAVNWVKEATVSRRWPNRVHVSIVERQPVAFVRIERAGAPPGYLLIDEEGVLLPVPAEERFDLVVLAGMTGREPESARRLRVRQALALLREAGPLARRITEVDVRDPGNLEAVAQVDDQTVRVKVGARNYAARLRNFFRHYEDIHLQRPQARLFDLRIDDRITAIEGETSGGR